MLRNVTVCNTAKCSGCINNNIYNNWNVWLWNGCMGAQVWFIKYDHFLFLAYVFLPVLPCVCVTWKLWRVSCGTLCSCYETSWIRANWNTSHYFTFDPKRWNYCSLTKQPELQSLQRMEISNELIPFTDFFSFSHLFPHPKVKDTLAIKNIYIHIFLRHLDFWMEWDL